MSKNQNRAELEMVDQRQCGSCYQSSRLPASEGFSLSRRRFLRGVGYGAAGTALGSVAFAATEPRAGSSEASPASPFPRGATLRVKPAIIAVIPRRAEKTSWRWYGGIQTPEDVQQEVQRLEKDMKELATDSEFPLEFLPMAVVGNEAQADQVAAGDQDAVLIFGACSYDYGHLASRLAANAPAVLFVRHRTEPHYCQHVSISWILLRRMTDSQADPNLNAHDVVVDDYTEILWRLRALYGLKNAKGTKMLAIGGLQHYSHVGTTHAPTHAQEVWDYDIENVSLQEFGKRLEKARADRRVVEIVEQQTDGLLAHRTVTLKTDRNFVFNSFMALEVTKRLMKEKGATNFGFGACMGRPVIGLLDTPPCLVLALANDEGYTAYCHADLTHTLPGVLLRWIASRPAFVANSHFPHNGIYTVAHCAAPRRMNGKDFEPMDIMTHYESDYGAATKVNYTKGQHVTVVIPALDCSKWQGFRGRIIDAPSRPACRSQMDIKVEGDWRKLQTDQVGFHVLVVYGDYLREVGYALKKLKAIGWENFSEA